MAKTATTPRYWLTETLSKDYGRPTRRTVRDSDATLIISPPPTLSGGSAHTKRCAEQRDQPCHHVYPGNDSSETFNAFHERHKVGTLNVAGLREKGATRL